MKNDDDCEPRIKKDGVCYVKTQIVSGNGVVAAVGSVASRELKKNWFKLSWMYVHPVVEGCRGDIEFRNT